MDEIYTKLEGRFCRTLWKVISDLFVIKRKKLSGNASVYLVHNVLLSMKSLELVVFVSEPKTLGNGDFETVKTIYFVKIRRPSCIER